MNKYKLTEAERKTMDLLAEKGGAFGLRYGSGWWREIYCAPLNTDPDAIATIPDEGAHALMSRRAKQQLWAEHPGWEIRQTPMGIWVVTYRRDDEDVEFAANDELAALIAALEDSP